jgi:hypothetical protein
MYFKNKKRVLKTKDVYYKQTTRIKNKERVFTLINFTTLFYTIFTFTLLYLKDYKIKVHINKLYTNYYANYKV